MPLETEVRTVNQLTARFCMKVTRSASLLTVAIGFSVLVGWLFDFRPLMTVLPGFVAMKPNTAVGLCFSGLSLFLFALRVHGGNRLPRRFAGALAGAVTIIGAVTLAEYIVGFNVGLDELIFRDFVGNITAQYPPGRMAPVTALNFVCLGFALVLLHFPKRTRWTHLLTGCAALTSLLAIVGYFYGVTSLVQSGNFTAVALHTAISFLALCTGVLCATSNFGFMRVISASGTSGTLVRRYGLAAIVSPFLVGWLRVQGGHQGWYGMEFGAAIFALASAAIFATLAWIGAGSLRAAERKQAVVQERLRLAHIDLEQRVIERTSELAEAHAGLQAQMLERARVEHNNQQIMDHSLDVICTFDAQGRFLHVNRACQAVWGYSPEELIGRPFLELVHPDDREKTMAVDQSVMGGEAENGFENRYLRRDGSVVPMVWTANWSEEHQTNFCVARDITARKKMEGELLRAKEIAEAATKAKGDFLANMSHEIRTPMNGVIGMTVLLLDTPLTGEQNEIAETIRTSAEALLTIINDILDFSKIEAGKLELEVVDIDLAHLVRGTLELLREIAKSKGLELRASIHEEVPTKLRGDGGRLRQVLINLLSNAIKFTPDGEVTLHVSVDRETRETAFLRFRVTDTGIGINAETQARLFQAFTQADGSITRRYGGTGLGLAICKQLVEKMHGAIGVESSPGAGSIFWFTVELPKQGNGVGQLSPPEITEMNPAESATDSGDEAGHGWRLRVLVAEDNAVNQRIAMAQLKKLGFAADSVTNGLEVLAALNRIPYEIILMDCQMPELDGYETTRQVRKRSGPQPYIIAMTASAMQGDRERCLAAGMDDYITKPVRTAALKVVLERCCAIAAESMETVSAAPNEPAGRAAVGFGSGSTESRPTTASSPEEPLVDMDQLRDVADGEPARMQQFIDLYLTQAIPMLDELEEAIQTNSSGAVARIAHKLIGSSLSCGVGAFTQPLRELERLGQAGDLTGANALFDDVRQKFPLVQRVLTQLMPHPSTLEVTIP